MPSWIPGGLRLRRMCSKLIFDKCGKNSCAEYGAFISNGSNIEIGDYSAIGINAYIGGTSDGGKLKIGNYVLMAPEVVILTSNHNSKDINIPMCYQGVSKETVVIEDDVWICTRVMIMPGVTIHRGVIAAAGAVVTKDIPPYAVVGGVPARILRMRK